MSENHLSFWKSTIIMEYNLVCHQAHKALIAKFVLFSGFGVGSFVAGVVSDKFGRRTGILIFSQLLLGAGFLATVMPDVTRFTIIWFFVGVAAIGIFAICIVWTLEIVAGRWKSIFGLTFALAWSISRLLVAFAAYMTADWKIFFQIFAGFHLVTPLVLLVVPESPRWLIAQKKFKEALEVLNEINRSNNKPEVSEETFNIVLSEIKVNEVKNERFHQIFVNPILRRRTLILYWNWFTASFIVYGLDLNWQTLSDSLFTNFIVGSFLQLIVKIGAIFVVVKGNVKKIPILVALLIAGTVFFLSLIFERGAFERDWPIIVLAIIGSSAMAFCFSLLWIYTSELYPTSLRNSSVGSCSFISRIGGMSANAIPSLASLGLSVPVILFGGSAFLAALLIVFLEETTGQPMPNTVAELSGNKDEKTCKSKQEELE